MSELRTAYTAWLCVQACLRSLEDTTALLRFKKLLLRTMRPSLHSNLLRTSHQLQTANIKQQGMRFGNQLADTLQRLGKV